MNMNNVQNNTWKYIKTEETDCTDCASLRDPVTGELKVQPSATTVQPFHKILLVGENIFLLHFYVLSTKGKKKEVYIIYERIRQ